MSDSNDPHGINAREARGRTAWAGREVRVDEVRDIRYSRREPDVPAAYEAEMVRAPIGYQIIERISGTLTADPPQITVPPSSERSTATAQASRLEKGTTEILREIARQQGEDPLERFIECLVADGHGCMRMFHVKKLWKGMPRQDKKANESDNDYNKRIEEWKRGKPIPISWQWVDPLHVFPEWDETGLHSILEVDQREVATLNSSKWSVINNPAEIHELARGDPTSSGGGQVKFSQLWTREDLTYALNGEVVHYQKHKYGRPPYVYAYGISPSTTDRSLKGLSVLYPLRHILPYLDRLLSQKATAVRIWCWPTPIIRNRSNQALLAQLTNGQEQIESGIPRTIEIIPGQAVTLYEDEEISFLTWQGSGPDADEMISIVMGMVQKAGLSDVMYGQAGSGDSGYLVNQLIAAARMKLKPIVTHAEAALEHMIQVLWDIVEFQIKQPLYAFSAHGNKTGWVSLDPEDMQGYRQVRAKVNPMLPTDTYAKSSQALNELQGGIRDVQGAMEEIGIDQPDEVMKRIAWDKYKNSPTVTGIYEQEIAKRYGLKMAEQQAGQMQMTPEQLQAAMQNGGLPPGLMQALAAGQMGAAGGQGVQAAPGVAANPGTPAPPASALGVQGPRQMPQGVAGGRAPGVRRTGNER